MQDYIAKCGGGEIFASCAPIINNSNQFSMYQHAMKSSREQSKLVLLVTGKENQKIALEFYRLLHYSSLLPMIRSRFVEVWVDEDGYYTYTPEPIRKAELALGVTMRDTVAKATGINWKIGNEMVVMDPKTNKIILRVSYSNLLEFMKGQLQDKGVNDKNMAEELYAWFSINIPDEFSF